MADEIAKKFAEYSFAVYGLGLLSVVVAVALLLWHVATEDAPEWVKLASLAGVIAGLTLISGAFGSKIDVKHACESGDISSEFCINELHVNPFPLPTLGPPFRLPLFSSSPSP